MNKSFRNSLKEIATGLFTHEQTQLRNSIVRAASALGAAYAQSQQEHMRNAALAVKYLVLQNNWDRTKPVVVMESCVFDDLNNISSATVKKRVTDALAGQPAQYKGMALTTEVKMPPLLPATRSCFSSGMRAVTVSVTVWNWYPQAMYWQVAKNSSPLG